MKNKTKKILCVASILGVVAISGIFAYLTDTESKENVFTVGKVDIELLEPSWPTEDLHGDAGNNDGPNGIPDAVENLVPNQVVAKDPQVKNVGKNDAYVFMRVQIKKTGGDPYTIINSDGSASYSSNSYVVDTVPNLNPDFSLIREAVSSGWIVLMNNMGQSEDTEGNEYTSMVFAYKTALEPGDTTPALFNGIQVKNMSEVISGLEGCIKVEAFAIQSAGLPADIAEDIDALEDIDAEDVEELSENYMAFNEAMGDVYNIIMNQNPDAQLAEFTPML